MTLSDIASYPMTATYFAVSNTCSQQSREMEEQLIVQTVALADLSNIQRIYLYQFHCYAIKRFPSWRLSFILCTRLLLPT